MEGRAQILFCDYDGDFSSSEILSKMGFLVDQIRPDALKLVSVGDHDLYIFTFQNDPSLKKALKTCEKLKAAQLPTPILLLHLGPKVNEDFLEHEKTSSLRANLYLHQPSESVFFDALDNLVGLPAPHFKKDGAPSGEDLEKLKLINQELQTKITDLEGRNSSVDKALEAQRKLFKPKLQALMKGQKVQLQTETERLKFELSELQAKLIDREAKIKELESQRERSRIKLEELTVNHERSRAAIREFYQNKIRTIENPDESDAGAGEDGVEATEKKTSS